VRRLFWYNSILLIAVCLLGCSRKSNPDNTIDILTLKGPSGMGMITLIDSPALMKDYPVNIEVLEEPMQVRARMLSDKPEFAVLPLNMAAILYNKGSEYQVLAIPVWGTLYLFGTDTTVKSWQDLKGKPVHLMGKGATPDILFRYLLERNGLTPGKDVLLDYSFPTHLDLSNAVIAGKAELAVISEPLVSLAEARNPNIHEIMDLNREWSAAVPDFPTLPQTALMVRRDFADKHPDQVIRIAEAWEKSTDFVNRNPGKAAGLISRKKILPDSTIAERSIPRCNLQFLWASQVRGAIDGYLQVFYTFNPDAVGGRLPDEAFVYKKPDH
jgi:NitT/TauT family transport system substrate-binding protein